MGETIELLCPYPHIDEQGHFADGLSIPQPRICVKCKNRECWSHIDQKAGTNLVHGVCPKGMSLVLFKFPVGSILCNGLIVNVQNSLCPPIVRKKFRSHKVGWEELSGWHRKLTQVLPALEDATERKVKEAIHGLHDVKTAVSLVTRNAEAIIATLPGDSDEEKIENAQNDLKALLKSVQLLHTRLSASSILANPEAASHGQKHSTPIHKVCFKMVRLFQEHAAKRRARIKMTGTSYAAPKCYDSFETIPLILIDNAVKYSDENREIIVNVQDVAGYVNLRVESFGTLVPESMRQTIFNREVRGPDSNRRVSRGSGLGLFIANIVAKAHGYEIKYECVASNESGTTGKNIFSCSIPIA